MEILEDNNFFQRLGLIKKFELKMNCTVDSFRETFQNKVGTDDSLKEFYFSKRNFKGTIRKYSFDMYKSLKGVDTGLSQFAAKGTYKEIENGLFISTAVYLPMVTFVLYFSMILLITIILFVNLIIQSPQHLWTILPICIAILTVIDLIFFFGFKKGVSKLTKELEEEFVTWDK